MFSPVEQLKINGQRVYERWQTQAWQGVLGRSQSLTAADHQKVGETDYSDE